MPSAKPVAPITGLFEAHLPVAYLSRSMEFYGERLGLERAYQMEERRVAFYWVGGQGRSMLGIWEAGTAPMRMCLHIAFATSLADVLGVCDLLRERGVTPLDFFRQPTQEPSVLAWMPSASVYFEDPDGHLLEYIALIDAPSRPDLGILPWSSWRSLDESRE